MSADFRDLIAARRDGKSHSQQDLTEIAKAAASGSVPDYQLSAWLMAAYLHPPNLQETVWLTLAMAESGEKLDLTGLPKPWVDKHSTGGVGDKTSIVLLPLLAACGVTLVKMSGPGLGITGGTVDKLKSIPGFRMELSPEEMIAQAAKIGLAVTGQTPNLAPADKTLYALRDATATTESIPLIVSSILSKKIAGGADTIVLDVKCGSGGFMKSLPEAETLAKSLLEVGKRCGLNIRIAVSDMSQPLGSSVGNALEVLEAISILTNQDLSWPSQRFRKLCLHFAGEVLAITKLATSEQEGREIAETALTDGQAAEKARQWIEAQGGPATLAEVKKQLPQAPEKLVHLCNSNGWIEKIDAEAVGQAVIELGGGRKHKGDVIDPSVGVVFNRGVGNEVSDDEPLFTVYAANKDMARGAATQVNKAIRVSASPVPEPDLILSQLV